MEMVFFVTSDTGKKMLAGISKDKKYGYSLFEDRLEVQSLYGDDLGLDSEGSPFLKKDSQDNCTDLFMWDGFANVSVSGRWKVSPYLEMATFLGMSEDMLKSIDRMNYSSCPLEFKGLEKDNRTANFLSEVMKASLVVGENEW